MATRADLIALAAIKRAREASRRTAVRPAKGDRGDAGAPGKDGITRIVREVVEKPAPKASDGVGIRDIEIEQDGEEVVFVITLTDGEEMRRKVTLPKGKDGKAGPVVQMRAFQRAPNNLSALHFNGDGTLTATLNGGDTVSSDNAAPSSGGSTAITVRTVTGDTTAVDGDDLIVVDSATTATVTLMASSTRNRPLYVKRLGVGSVIVQSAGADTIDGDPMKTINTQYTTLMLAQGWYVV